MILVPSPEPTHHSNAERHDGGFASAVDNLRELVKLPSSWLPARVREGLSSSWRPILYGRVPRSYGKFRGLTGKFQGVLDKHLAVVLANYFCLDSLATPWNSPGMSSSAPSSLPIVPRAAFLSKSDDARNPFFTWNLLFMPLFAEDKPVVSAG